MIKTKYQRMNAKDKKDARKKFYESPKGKETKKFLNRSLICSILLTIFGVYMTYDGFFNTNKLLDKIYGVAVLVISLLFYLFYFRIRSKKVNDFLTKK